MLIGYFNTYKNMFGTIEYDAVTDKHYGELINIDKKQNVSYEADNLLELEHAFHNAAEDYFAFCIRRGVEL